MTDTTRKAFSVSAGILVSIYLSLAVVAFFCAASHADHHGHDTHHSPLCAWACQANSSVGLVGFEAPTLPLLLAIYLLPFLSRSPISVHKIRLSTRGPPAY